MVAGMYATGMHNARSYQQCNSSLPIWLKRRRLCFVLLQVLMATSTLAAGINLPARRVILRTLWQGVSNVGRAQYLQMIGRAGRAGAKSNEAHRSGGGLADKETCALLLLCNQSMSTENSCRRFSSNHHCWEGFTAQGTTLRYNNALCQGVVACNPNN